MKARKKNTRGKRIVLAVVLVVIAAAGAAGYAFWQKSSQSQSMASAATPTYNTATARLGTLVLSATGSGSLQAGDTANLSFPADGTVGSVSVRPGDSVTAGQELAVLADTTDLEIKLKSAELDYTEAKLALEELKSEAGASIASAQLAVEDAKKAVTDARSNVVEEGWVRCDQATIDAYFTKYEKARRDLEALGDGGGNADYYLNLIVPARNRAAQAYASYDYCLNYTEYEINSSRAKLTLAEAALESSQKALDTLLEHNGIDPDKLTLAENQVTLAKMAYESAQKKLAQATMTAPFDGTVISVGGKMGDEVNALATFITVADLVHPQVAFSVDETDADKVAIGGTAEVTFDALPDQVFAGQVVQVNPSLTTSNNIQVLSGLIEIDLTGSTALGKLLPGMNATVEIISGRAENAVLVPVEALTDLGDGSYSVLVVENGKLKLRVVEVGIMDATYAEIKSGLQAGEVVTTGAVETE